MLTLYVVMKTVQNNIKEPNKTVWNLHGTSSTFSAPHRHISTSIQSAVLTWMCGDIHRAKSKPLFNIIESFGLAVLHSVCLRVLLINAGSGSSGSSDEWLQREAGS